LITGHVWLEINPGGFMPTYVYKNLKTGKVFELEQRITEAVFKKDPKTGDPVERVIQASGIVFKGGGFYKTDSRPAEKSGKSPDKSSDKSEADSSKSSDSGASGTDSAKSSSEKASSSAMEPSKASSTEKPAKAASKSASAKD
jgi:predicted nucleic acid-binding Zn ribbon protein